MNPIFMYNTLTSETYMAKNLLSIHRQIEKLQKEAAVIKAKEVGGVIERIRTAIEFYGLTPADLFETKVGAISPSKRKGSAAGPLNKMAAKKEKKVSVIKYRDETGKTWTGHGKRPGWFIAALESGKTTEDLLVKV